MQDIVDSFDHCPAMEVDGIRQIGGPRKTWKHDVKENMKFNTVTKEYVNMEPMEVEH